MGCRLARGLVQVPPEAAQEPLVEAALVKEFGESVEVLVNSIYVLLDVRVLGALRDGELVRES